MDKVFTRIAQARQPAADLAYWLGRPMAERIGAVETLRRDLHLKDGGADAAEPRLQKVCATAQRRGR